MPERYQVDNVHSPLDTNLPPDCAPRSVEATSSSAEWEPNVLTYGSLFSGIGGFDLGFDRAGLRCAWQVEIDETCRKVLGQHWSVPQFTDVKDFHATDAIQRPDWIVGGFPCQDVSVAGRRAGLAGKRSWLWWEFHRIVREFSPTGVCIENVPGLLSSNGGRDMGAILWSLGQLGYGVAYRVLDAQWFGVAQRRRRVFIVGHLGGVERACQILFESDCLPWDSAPSREAEQEIAPCVRGGTDSGSNEHGNKVDPTSNIVAYQCQGSNVGPMGSLRRGNGNETGGVPFFAIQEGAVHENLNIGPQGKGYQEDIGFTLEARSHVQAIAGRQMVRRLMPVECDRLQAFPDDWEGSDTKDSPRYRMLGNAICVNVAEWIGRRIVASTQDGVGT